MAKRQITAPLVVPPVIQGREDSKLNFELSLLRLWLRGGFPPSFLARSEEASFAWREDLIRTFLERDLSQIGFSLPAPTLRRFWAMVAHSHGQVWNSSDIGRSLGVSDGTARAPGRKEDRVRRVSATTNAQVGLPLARSLSRPVHSSGSPLQFRRSGGSAGARRPFDAAEAAKAAGRRPG